MDEQSISIGEYLKSARAKRRLTIPEVSQELHIREDYLEALEKDAWDRLPGEVYGQGFLRSYARYLDADAEQLVQYRKRLAAKEPPAAATPSRRTPPPTRQRRNRAPVQKPVAPQPTRRSAPTAAKEPQGSGRVVLGAAVVLAVLFGVGLYLLPKSAPTTTAGAGTSHTPSTSVNRQHHHSPKSPPPSKTHPAASPSPTITLTSNQVQSGGNTTVVYAVSQTPVTVHLSFTGPCWVEVWRNGVTANPYGVTYQAGQTLTVTANASVKVRLGTRLANVAVNGHPVSVPDPTQRVINLTFQHS